MTFAGYVRRIGLSTEAREIEFTPLGPNLEKVEFAQCVRVYGERICLSAPGLLLKDFITAEF